MARKEEVYMIDGIALFAEVVKGAIPYGMAFAIGEMIVNTFMKMAFGGKIDFK
jgi:hypothetical protein